MTDISKKKEAAKRGIRALLISAPLGLTFKELRNDYQEFVGKLPGEDIGYNSFEDFIKDIPDVVQVQHEGGNMVLRAVADSTTKHIEKMVSKQKIDSKKQMRIKAKRNSDAMRSGPLMSLWSTKPPVARLYKPANNQRPYSGNSSNHNNWSGRAGNMNYHNDGPRTFHNNQRNDNTGSNYQNRMPPRHRPQAHHRTVPCLPAHIQRDIRELVIQHREGLPLTHFSRIFRARYRVHFDPLQLGYQDEYELLASIPDIVSLKRFQQGEMRVLPVGAPANGRPRDDRYQQSSGSTNNNQSHSSNSSPPHQKSTTEDTNRQSPKPQDENWDNLMDQDACSNIPEYIQLRLEKMIGGMPEGIKASCLLSEYKKIFRIDLPIKSYGYNSAIEFVSDLSHIFRSERPNKFDWVLYPVKGGQSTPSGSGNGNQASNATNKKSEGDAKPKNANEKKASTSPPPLLSSLKVEWEVKEAISQVLSLNPKGIPLDEFVGTYKEMTGRTLNVERYGVDSVKSFLHSLKDILYIMLDESDQPMVCLTHEGGPRKFDLLRDKYKPITPAPKPQPLMSLPVGGRQVQQQQQEQKPVYPPQAVTPGCHYKPQPVTYIDTGNSQQNYIEVYVSFTTNPGHFWVQLRGPQTTLALEDLMDALEECYGDPTKPIHTTKEKEYRMAPEFAKPGMVCAVIYPEDLYWHRGLITGCKDNLYEVFFVDYGNTCYVSLENMRLLKTKFLTLPAQAIRARLSNVEPIKETWSVRARQRFLDLTRERPLLGFVTAFKHRILSLCLTDTSGKDDIHINDLLTHEGYADFKPDTGDSLVVEDKQTCSLQVLTNDFLYGKQHGTGEESSSHQGPQKSAANEGSSGPGGDGDASWRRYVRQAQLSDDRVFNLIFLGGENLYLMSSEISSLFFEEDIISAKLRRDKTNIPKVVVTKEEYPDLYKELLSYEVSAINESTALLSLFPLKALPLMMQMYGNGKDLGETKDIVLNILEWFDPNDPYWKGEDDQSSEGGDLDDEEDAATDSQSVVSDSRESFKMEDLRMVLEMLQMKRNRSLKRLLEGGDTGNKEAEVNSLNQVEIDIRRVEALIESFEEKTSASESKQKVSQAVNKNTSSSSSSTSSSALHQLSKSQKPSTASSISSSSLLQQQQPQHLRQANPAAAASSVPPITATVAPTPKLTSSASLSSSVTSSSAAASALSSSALSSSMLAGFGGGLGTGGMGSGLGRGFGIGAGGLPGLGSAMGGLGGSMDMGEMLRQQMNMNSLLMSQMGMMNTTPMMPSLPLSMEQMQQQQALLQQQMLVQQQQRQQQQQQLLLRCQQQQNLRPGQYPSSSSSSTIPQAPGLTGFNPLLRSQLLGKTNSAGAVPSSSAAVIPPSSGTSTTSTPSSNMFCANLGRVLSSALNDETKFPSAGRSAEVGANLTSNFQGINLNKRS